MEYLESKDFNYYSKRYFISRQGVWYALRGGASSFTSLRYRLKRGRFLWLFKRKPNTLVLTRALQWYDAHDPRSPYSGSKK